MAPAIIKAFAEAFIKAIPTGHQNSFAAHRLPASVLIVARSGQPVSLVDAFENPIRPSNGQSLLENSVKALDEHWADISKMYGDSSIKYKGIVTRSKLAKQLNSLKEHSKHSLDILIEEALKVVFPEGEGQ